MNSFGKLPQATVWNSLAHLRQQPGHEPRLVGVSVGVRGVLKPEESMPRNLWSIPVPTPRPVPIHPHRNTIKVTWCRRFHSLVVSYIDLQISRGPWIDSGRPLFPDNTSRTGMQLSCSLAEHQHRGRELLREEGVGGRFAANARDYSGITESRVLTAHAHARVQRMNRLRVKALRLRAFA